MLHRAANIARHPLAAGTPARASREQCALAAAGDVRTGKGGGSSEFSEKPQRGRSVTRAA
jgi:hypothetical protein